jgi:hypothetical protein
LQRRSGNDPLDGLTELEAVGYDRFIAYDNLGVMLTTGRLGDARLVHDLTDYVSAKPYSYWDLAIFASDDEALFASVVSSETKHRAGKAQFS